jgi:hypothetical protein
VLRRPIQLPCDAGNRYAARSRLLELSKKRFSFLVMVCLAFVSHSQITRTRQPARRSRSSFSVSRSTLRESFAAQNSLRVVGKVDFRHPLCWCQKQPWTKTTDLKRGKTMSGLPGKSSRCSAYR